MILHKNFIIWNLRTTSVGWNFSGKPDERIISRNVEAGECSSRTELFCSNDLFMHAVEPRTISERSRILLARSFLVMQVSKRIRKYTRHFSVPFPTWLTLS